MSVSYTHLDVYKRQDIIQHLFRIQIIADNLTVHSDINHVERMDAVPVIHIDTVVDLSLIHI